MGVLLGGDTLYMQSDGGGHRRGVVQSITPAGTFAVALAAPHFFWCGDAVPGGLTRTSLLVGSSAAGGFVLRDGQCNNVGGRVSCRSCEKQSGSKAV